MPLLTKLRGLGKPDFSKETKENFLISIYDEISRLIDTRVGERPNQLSKINILNYGIIDSAFDELADDISRNKTENYLEQIIRHFEPRISNLRVHISKNQNKKINVQIHFEYYFKGNQDTAEFVIDPSGLKA